MNRPPRLLLAVLLLALGPTGCDWAGRAPTDPRLFSFYRHPSIEGIRRIAVVPLYRGPEVGSSAAAFDPATATAWRELGCFEVMVMDAATRDRYLPHDVIAHNNLPSDALRRLYLDHRIDAVLVGRIEQFDCYDPISAGVTLNLVSCRDGGVKWSATCHFDAARTEIQEDVHRWYAASRGEANPDIAGWRATLQTPRLFARYLSDRLASSALRDSPQQATASRRRLRPRLH